jgi:hypothetical protein
MKQNPSTESSTSQPLGDDAISRRAYELWEKEGRPEGSDLRHWLQAEQDLRTSQPDNGNQSGSESNIPPNTGSDTVPLQGTRAAGAANRESKRGSPTGAGPDKTGVANGNSQSAARRKPSSAPAM